MSLKKVAVIGAGNVGAEIANQIVCRELANIVLIDKYGDIAKGKALDILTSAALKNSSSSIIGSDDFTLVTDSDIVIITAGLPRKPGMSREELVEANGNIISEIVTNIKKFAPNSIIIIVTNPLDVMTYLAYKISGFKPEKVLGMAGVLDTARFKTFIAEELGVTARDVNAVVLGGHGDEMVPLIDCTTVAGIPIKQLADDATIEKIVERTRKGGIEIVNLLKTGSAYYAPAVSAVEMTEAIIKDKKSIMPVSVYLQGEYGLNDIYFGVPAVLGTGGAEKVVEFKLNNDALEKLKTSANVVRETIEKLKCIK
ncbi:MAG: malate dehydrogenase [Candidatus Melainabacteria bacterium GWF2_37_15]|nr:MAG: malate dehydrogenase [Candidatus Melainabacteria bacterium GWF2_37_15]